jgi:nucleoside-diphosphate-sugar epimerase
MRLARLPLIPVIGDGQQALQPVHISDVVATVMHSLNSSQACQTLDIVGSETITFAEWLQTMRRAQGLPPARLVHLPFPKAMALTRIGRHFNPILQPDNLRMLQKGYWADYRPLIRFLGRPPLTVEASLFLSDAAPTGSTS